MEGCWIRAGEGVLYTRGNESCTRAWLDTFDALGYRMKEDPFSGSPMGAFAPLATLDPITAERSNGAVPYYAPAADRKNLTVLTSCLVEEILFKSGESKFLATGIQYTRDGTSQVATACKEVILAAGSFQSPKIFELSGIGSAGLLKLHGIETLVDNPGVGEISRTTPCPPSDSWPKMEFQRWTGW